MRFWQFWGIFLFVRNSQNFKVSFKQENETQGQKLRWSKCCYFNIQTVDYFFKLVDLSANLFTCEHNHPLFDIKPPTAWSPLSLFFTLQLNFIPTNIILASTKGIKQPWSLNCRSCCSIYPRRREKKWLPLSLHWLTVRVCCEAREEGEKGGVLTQILCANSFPQGLLQEKSPLHWYSPHMRRLHLLFITSWLYFSSKFQAGVQSAKKETLPACVYVCSLCKHADRAPLCSLA